MVSSVQFVTNILRFYAFLFVLLLYFWGFRGIPGCPDDLLIKDQNLQRRVLKFEEKLKLR